MIKDYKFGAITIGDHIADQTFHDDVRVSPGKTEKWWRVESHQVTKKDIDKAVAEKPEVIVIGTGDSGLMNVPEEIRDYIEYQHIHLIELRTAEAVEEFNRLEQQGRKVIGLFHLTC